MAQHKMKSSLGGPGNSSFDPDCWLTSRDRTLMLCGRDGDDRVAEITLWDKPTGFTVIYHDRQTQVTVSASDPYFTNAKRAAQAQLASLQSSAA